MNELFDIYKRNFPYCVREDSFADLLLNSKDNDVIEKRDCDGKLIAVSVIHKNNILMFCVDKEYRRKKLGTELLAETEKLIKEKGYSEITVGAGDSYLMPGIPSDKPIVAETLESDCITEGVEDIGVSFFKKHGYIHKWDCNCFDMRMKLKNFSAEPKLPDGINFRWATVEDIPDIVRCTDDANKGFSDFYKNENIYETKERKVLIAEENGVIVGTIMAVFGVEGKDIGSIGCTAVKRSHRGKKIATNLTILATGALKDSGLKDGFLGYTYTGLDKMYGAAGYKICSYYFMAKKAL